MASPRGSASVLMGGRPVDNALLTTEQAAARLGLGKHTLEVWRMKEEGPAFSKLGGRLVRYQSADLDAFIAATRRSNSVGDTIN